MDYLHGGIIGAAIVVAIDVLLCLYLWRLNKVRKQLETDIAKERAEIEKSIRDVFEEKKAKVEEAISEADKLIKKARL